MRYYAGNWATSQWLFRKDSGAEDKLDEAIVRSPRRSWSSSSTQLYDARHWPSCCSRKGLAFRSMHSHGRALNGLVTRAVDDLEAYHVREGELISRRRERLELRRRPPPRRAAARGRAGALPVRARASCAIVTLESQPAHVQRQHYRIYDAATGLIEEGYVEVADMVARQPWLDADGCSRSR